MVNLITNSLLSSQQFVLNFHGAVCVCVCARICTRIYTCMEAPAVIAVFATFWTLKYPRDFVPHYAERTSTHALIVLSMKNSAH